MLIDMSKVCKCECHKKGQDIMEFTPCCEFCGEKYLNPDGSFDGCAYAEIMGGRDGKRKRREHKL